MPVKPLTVKADSAKTKAPGSFRMFTDSFRRSLLAQNKAPRTIQTYMEALGKFGDFLASQGMPTEIHAIHREHVEAFLADLLGQGHKPATVANRYRSIQAFFKWAL